MLVSLAFCNKAQVFGESFRETVFPDAEEEHSCLLMLRHKGSLKNHHAQDSVWDEALRISDFSNWCPFVFHFSFHPFFLSHISST